MSQTRDCISLLPPELRRWILGSFSDIRSLISVIQTSSAFHAVFESDKHKIIRDVLSNVVGPDVLREATNNYRCCPPCSSMFINDAWLLGRENTGRMESYVSSFLNLKEAVLPISSTLTMQGALQLQDLHTQVVRPLARRFIQSCAKLSAPQFPLEDSLSSNPASPLEEDRIMRSLYRFEVFNKLFGLFTWPDEEVSDYRFKSFIRSYFSETSPWEIAQLACIHDFLAREVMTGTCRPYPGEILDHVVPHLLMH